MKAIHIFFLIFSANWIISCSDSKQDKEDQAKEKASLDRPINPENSNYQVEMNGIDTALFNQYYERRIHPPVLDLNQSMGGKTISELELLKNTLLAMKGNLFDDALFHNYFDTIAWYQPPFWDSAFSITLNEDEKWFIERITAKETELKERNYNDNGTLNLDNTLNAFQWPELMNDKLLKNNGFFMESTDNSQFFDIYETNQRRQIPSFITTDLILHQMHLFYGMLENEIEGKYLTEKLKTMIEIINVELYASYEKTLDPKIEQAIEESLLYYSIPYAMITGKKTNLIGRYNEVYVDELTKVINENGKGSQIMNDDQFDYAIFKPYGQYAKNNSIKKYYKSLTWLQKVSLCLNNENDFNKALIVAYIIYKSDKLKNEYSDYMELKTYFSTQKDQFTLWDLASEIGNNENIKFFEDLFKAETIAHIKAKLGIKDGEDCKNTVSLMPIEYQNLFTDLKEITGQQQESPSSTDLFAALNNPAATKLYNESNNSEASQEYLSTITGNLVRISSQEDARSMDWISTLLTSFSEENQSKSMIHEAWKTKELNAAMASWVQLNQRVNLRYKSSKVEEISREEKVLIAYVEPNTIFWKNAVILLTNTQDFLSERNILSSNTSTNLINLLDLIGLLHLISEKELNGLEITNDEFNIINSIAERCHTLALQLINPNIDAQQYQLSNSMMYATNIYRSNGDKNLIAGIGKPNTFMALAEINGNIYLTRGAAYSYYEIPGYNRQSISQSNWKKLIDDNLVPPHWVTSLYSDKSN